MSDNTGYPWGDAGRLSTKHNPNTNSFTNTPQYF